MNPKHPARSSVGRASLGRERGAPPVSMPSVAGVDEDIPGGVCHGCDGDLVDGRCGWCRDTEPPSKLELLQQREAMCR